MSSVKRAPFPCNGCGKCCGNVHLSELTKALDRGDGTCRYLDTHSKQCQIYEQRPEICRVELQYQQNYSEQYEWQEFVDMNLVICRSLPEPQGWSS
ncbi:YkgJ family cysteine cluster protein [Photobacterium jeanii]|uniref:YkgJ family cysteine cluster protein n=1 Tax=Photobacterium jeanii TaxID=858640 RepID=UPI000A0405A8|nr:YkgJ family cysteine cluster protein [Photobacterium jeanii]PST92348.1 zinc/iron-chelating domain-containing protein [Photobacterium jeanii]